MKWALFIVTVLTLFALAGCSTEETTTTTVVIDKPIKPAKAVPAPSIILGEREKRVQQPFKTEWKFAQKNYLSYLETWVTCKTKKVSLVTGRYSMTVIECEDGDVILAKGVNFGVGIGWTIRIHGQFDPKERIFQFWPDNTDPAEVKVIRH